MPRTFPHGLDCEAFTIKALAEAAVSTSDQYDREHVTPWLRRAEHLKRANLASDDVSLAELRWTLDYSEDMEFLRTVFARAPKECRLRMPDVLSILAELPEIGDINSIRREMPLR
jgi:spore coat polysaccharide biosynthesis protein SpsF (cytidylyltransferase family)